MKRILRRANVILLVAFITSCSFFVNTKEIEKNADAAFQVKNFDEFNKLYEN